MSCFSIFFFFFFKQKTAYELRISDWSSDVCSSDLVFGGGQGDHSSFCEARSSAVAVGEAVEAPVGVEDPSPSPSSEQAASGSSTEAEIGRASCRERVCQYV